MKRQGLARRARADDWSDRFARARTLAERYPDAREILTFYAALVEYQRALASRIGSRALCQAGATSSLRIADAGAVITALADFLAWLPPFAPRPLAVAASAMEPRDPEDWQKRFEARLASPYLDDEEDPVEAFVAEALLQPLAECAVGTGAGSHEAEADAADGAGTCPACGNRPVAGVLREEGQGAKRTLVCALCLTEWRCPRLLCAGCGERRFEVLPVYTAEQFPHARVEACDGCGRYLKTIDATRDGHAVAVVDDLASVALDVWARDQGYARLHPNLLRL